MPSTNTLHNHFGSYRRIYELVGYDLPAEDLLKGCEQMDRTMRLRHEVVRQVSELFPGRVSVTHFAGRSRSIFRLKNGMLVALLLCRTVRRYGRLRWRVVPCRAEHELITLACMLNPAHDRIQSYHVFPHMMFNSHWSHRKDPWLAEGIQLKTLSEFYAAVERLRVERSTTGEHGEDARPGTRSLVNLGAF